MNKQCHKKSFKKIGKAILVSWVIGSILVVIWPYGLIGWPEIEDTLDYWGDYSLILWGALFMWCIGCKPFIWESRD